MPAFPSFDAIPNNVTLQFIASQNSGFTNPVSFKLSNIAQGPSGLFDCTNAASGKIRVDNGLVGNAGYQNNVQVPTLSAQGVGTCTFSLTGAQVATLYSTGVGNRGNLTIEISDSTPTPVIVGSGGFTAKVGP